MGRGCDPDFLGLSKLTPLVEGCRFKLLNRRGCAGSTWPTSSPS